MDASHVFPSGAPRQDFLRTATRLNVLRLHCALVLVPWGVFAVLSVAFAALTHVPAPATLLLVSVTAAAAVACGCACHAPFAHAGAQAASVDLRAAMAAETAAPPGRR